jgi:exopolyphosphatase/guanosine-5'-triphosphate,3'-diphosphate pyrophosphatase
VADDVVAAIDVGATSVHLLAARPAAARLEAVRDESRFAGLGDLVAGGGRLGWPGIAGLLDALGDLLAGSPRVSPIVVATDPLRRAPDAALAVRAVEDRLGLAVHVLTPREEGLLTWVGAFAEAGAPAGAETVLVDVGGGSTEVVVGTPGQPPRIAGLPVGAGRFDPTRPDVMTRAAPDARPVELVAVGGTADNLRKLAPAGGPEGVLDRATIRAVVGRLATEAPEVVAVRHGLRSRRVRLLPAGAAILLALLDRYGLDTLRVSPAGLREGVLVASLAAGDAWRDALERLARGSRPPGPAGGGSRDRPPPATEPQPRP